MRLIKIGVGFLVVGLTTAFFGFFPARYATGGTAELMEDLQEAPVNSVIRLSDYLRVEAPEACLLTPYQDSVSLEESRNAVKVNTRIKEDPFSYDLDQFWKLALLQRDKIEFVRINIHKFGNFKRDELEENELSMFARSEFLQKICSDFVSSGFIKFKINEQLLFTFGGIGN